MQKTLQLLLADDSFFSMEKQDLFCTYLAHHEPEGIPVMIVMVYYHHH